MARAGAACAPRPEGERAPRLPVRDLRPSCRGVGRSVQFGSECTPGINVCVCVYMYISRVMKLIRSRRRGNFSPHVKVCRMHVWRSREASLILLFFNLLVSLLCSSPHTKKKKKKNLLVFSASYLCVSLPHTDGKVPFALIHSPITHSALNGGFKAL